jgi:SPP1 gp7 family putative phage head morphogenesis protein
MSWAVTGDVVRFDEAADWFRSKIPVTATVADTLADYSGSRAFTVAALSQLEIVELVHASLLQAIERGTPFEEWKAEIEDVVTEAWGKKDSPHLQLIYRNATSQAYSAGRWRQMHEPSVKRFRPYGLYDGIADSRQTAFCKAWHGVIRKLEDFAEAGAVPQTHHACRSSIRNLRESEALRRGVTELLPQEVAADGFGKAPTESQWSPDPGKYNRELFDEYQFKRGELARTTTRPRLDGQ